MSCYIRHLKDFLAEADIEVTSANRNQIDQAIHRITGTPSKDCPATWKMLKEQIIGSEQKKRALIKKLEKALS